MGSNEAMTGWEIIKPAKASKIEAFAGFGNQCQLVINSFNAREFFAFHVLQQGAAAG